MELKQGYKRTEVGTIPRDWVVRPLGSFCEIIAGGDLVKADYASMDDRNHPFPIYSNALANKGLYGYSRSHQYDADRITVTARGDIGHAVYRSTRFCAIGRLLVLSSSGGDYDLRFVTEFINNVVNFALESTGVPQLTVPQISKCAVALPPTKAEQEAIAEVLSDADALIESLEQLIAKKRQIKQGAMQELLTGQRRLPGFETKRGYKQTEVGVIPTDWQVSALGALLSALDAGVSVNSVEKAADVYAHDEAILKTSCVMGGKFLPHEHKKILPRDRHRAKVSPCKDSIVISGMNTPALVGECGYIDQDYPTLFLPDRLWMTRHDGKRVISIVH